MLIRQRTKKAHLSKILTGMFNFGLVVIVGILNMKIQPTKAASNYLHTSGSQIMDASNQVVGLSGLNWFGFETANHAPHGLWVRNWQEILDQIKSLGYNVIRLPFSDAMLQPGVVPAGIEYSINPDLANLSALQVMDKIIAGAGERGIMIILDNHRSTPGGGPEANGLWYTAEYPESRFITDWQMLATRYLNSPNVIGVDLRNEPHGLACWGCGDLSRDWRLAAERAGNTILAINPGLLIIVEGVSTYNGQSTWWGGNLMGVQDYPVRLNVPDRLVYSTHEYPESVASQPWFNDPNYPDNLPAIWDQYWGYVFHNNLAPVLVGEFGTRYQTVKDQQWMQSFIQYIQENGLNWTYWALNPNSGDTGGLLQDDWTSVVQVKQDLLEQIQYPMIGSAIQPPTITPPPSPTPAPTATLPPPNPGGSALVLDDFESGSTDGWNTFQDPGSMMSISVISPGQMGNYAMRIDYRLATAGWGGAGRGFAQSQDWRAYNQFSFQFFGEGTGNTIRLELLDDRAPGTSGDTSERYTYQFVDNFPGWNAVNIPWNAFTRRSDWQPAGAPNNGLTLSQIWGFNFSPIAGTGSFYLDQVQLLTTIPAPTISILENFETGNTNQWMAFNDPQSGLHIRTVSPGNAGNYAMLVNADLVGGGWGSAALNFPSPQDWTVFDGIDFWLFGGNSGNTIRLEVLDNKAAGSSGDTSERFEYLIPDNWSGWRHFTLRWSAFSRRRDWQPNGAPDDGFTLTRILGLNFSPTAGRFSFQVDEIGLYRP